MEMARAGAPGTSPFGPKMCAPVIMKYGSAEQKARHLPPMLNSDLIWCQGYSEPGSGSDLASLRTKAVREGDHYIVNGQKTWTTLAQTADWIFCLVRTSTDGKPQEGISFLLIDMKTPGITVQPIITADGNRAGTQEVNSVFFTDVKVPVENRVGEAARLYGMPFPEQRAWNANVEPIGPEGADTLAPRYFNGRKMTIYGGSSEVQRGIMSKVMLGL